MPQKDYVNWLAEEIFLPLIMKHMAAGLYLSSFY